ncbi:ACT domain-containing protein [Microvirga rosea]|uniref:ACT domain-containing protein n=1 Tax=Microvirga rosea TaxID=2715425 RepID=UPI001D0B0897|nr:ACT domain-containing protein [Microvirga rosea]MCB8822644.1 ACT domain-containing protein [Microvirga rosea]
MPNLTLSLAEETFAVCRLPADLNLRPRTSRAMMLLVQAPDETTLVCPVSEVPEEAEADRGWRCFRIEQTFDFSVPGILASVLTPLANAGIGIFATSTFSTDYILVKATDLSGAIAALTREGHKVTGS